MIGNLADATAAFNREVPEYDRGSSRKVYLIDGVIYKIDLVAYCNEDEWKNYRSLSRKKLPDYLAIPKMSRYVVHGQTVIASEFIDGIPLGECFDRWLGLPCEGSMECLPLAVENAVHEYIDDAVYGNIIVSNGIYYLVDIET